MINKEHYQIIRQHPAFAHFPVEIFDKIAIEIQFRKIPKGQIIFFSGDRRDRLFLLHRGYVRIEQYDSTDTFSYMDYVKMNSVFPYGGMFFDERYHYTASAVTNVEYFSIPMDLFEDYSKKNVDQLLFITKRLSQILEFQECRLSQCDGPCNPVSIYFMHGLVQRAGYTSISIEYERVGQARSYHT